MVKDFFLSGQLICLPTYKVLAEMRYLDFARHDSVSNYHFKPILLGLPHSQKLRPLLFIPQRKVATQVRYGSGVSG